MGYGNSLEPYLSRRTGTRAKWSLERLEAKRRQIEKGTLQEDITELVEKTKRGKK
jgi:hypothetical protein